MKPGLLVCIVIMTGFNLSFANESPTSGGADGPQMIINSTAKLGVVCHDEYIEVTVERENYPGLDTNVTHLEDEACVPGYRDEDKVVFRFGLEDCKTQHEEDKEAIHYKNRIIAVVKDEDEDKDITRSNTRVLPFQCSYKKKAFVSKVTINSHFIRVATAEADFGNFTFLMNIYNDKDYSTKVEEFPFEVGINQRLYLEARVQSGDPRLVVFPDECKATPSRNANAKPEHPIIDQACPRDKSLEYEYTVSATQRFSLLAFRFISGYDDVYIHCKLTVCQSNDTDSKCAKGCGLDDNDSRKKRQITEDYGASLFLGPIKISAKKDRAMNSPHKGITERPQMFLLVGLLVGVLGVVALGLITALIVVITRRRPAGNAATLLVQDE